MATWDRRTPDAQRKVRDARLREQLRDGVGPFSPYWRERFSALKVPASSIAKAEDLAKLPAIGERDVCPTGDPRDAARLVLQADEQGFALHVHGPELRKAIAKRAGGKQAYRRQVEAAIRPTTYHWAGAAFTFPVASTRSDLDLVARAGNRAWEVLGLTGADVLVSAIPVAQRLDHLFLWYAALAAGAPALFPGAEGLAGAVRLVSPTVVAARSAADLDGIDLTSVKTVLLVNAAAEEREAVGALTDAKVLALHGPEAGRVLWAECAPGSGFHTYPDLDLVEVLDPDLGTPAKTGELAVTQLGFRGSALLRWRTGDVVEAPLETGACRHCKRTVPRIPAGVRPGAFVRQLSLRDGSTAAVDVRAVTGALAGRKDVADWRVELRKSVRDGSDELVVFVVPSGDETDAAVNVYRDVRAASGTPATQVVVARPEELAALAASGRAVSERVAVRD